MHQTPQQYQQIACQRLLKTVSEAGGRSNTMVSRVFRVFSTTISLAWPEMAAKYFCVVCLFVLPMPQLHVTGAVRLIPSIPVIDTAILRTVRSNPGRPSRLILTERTEDRLTCSLNGSPPFAASMKILQLVPGGGERYLAGMRTSAPAALSRDALSYFPDAEVSGDWTSRTMTLSLKGVNMPAIGTYRCDVYCYDHLASSDDPSTWSRVVHVTHDVDGAKRFASNPPGFDVTSETQLCLQSTAQKKDCCGSHNFVSGKTSTSDVTEAPGKAYEITKAEEVTKLRKANQVRKTKRDSTGVTEPPAFGDDNISGKKNNTQGDSDNIKNIDRNAIIDDLEHNIKNIDNDIQMNGDTSEGRQAGNSTGGSKHMGVHSDACPFGGMEWRSDGSFHLKFPQADYVCIKFGQGTSLCDLQHTERNHDTGHSSNGCTILCITVIIVIILVVIGFVALVVFFDRRRLKTTNALVPVPPCLCSCPTSLFGNSRTRDGRKLTGQETEEFYREHNGLHHF